VAPNVAPGPSVAVLAVASVLSAAFLVKLPCFGGGWAFEPPYRVLCYSDIPPTWEHRGLSDQLLPYVEARNEYPALTGLFMWVASLGSGDVADYFRVQMLLLASLAVLTVVELARVAGRRALYFALAPSLFLYGFLNWDLLPVAATTLATVWFLRHKETRAGIALGLGAAAKIYPALLVLPFAVDRWRLGQRRTAFRLGSAAAIAWLVVNLPFALGRFEGWSYFFRFSAERPPTLATVWAVGCRWMGEGATCSNAALVNVLSLSSLVAGCLAVWARCRRNPDFPRWTLGFPLIVVLLLTSKVYSPQYGLWLVPWFALVLPDVRLFIAFEVADVTAFLVEFAAIFARQGFGTFPLWAVDLTTILRVAVLVGCLIVYMRRPGQPETASGPARAAPADPSFR